MRHVNWMTNKLRCGLISPEDALAAQRVLLAPKYRFDLFSFGLTRWYRKYIRLGW